VVIGIEDAESRRMMRARWGPFGVRFAAYRHRWLQKLSSKHIQGKFDFRHRKIFWDAWQTKIPTITPTPL